MNLCFVIQRYGLEVAGGAELHCRWLAESLAKRHTVSVETTTALDYITWENHFPSGSERLSRIEVRRHPVKRPRDGKQFSLIQDLVFNDIHGKADEEEWVRQNGPFAPMLLRSLDGRKDVDLFLFYCYRYYQSFFGIPRVADRAVLVPTAEEDPAIHLPVFRPLFQAPRGMLYLTPEEKALVEGVGGNEDLPNHVMGTGIAVPEPSPALDVQARFSLPKEYLLYVGRIDRNKGVDRLVQHYLALAREHAGLPPLVLVGRQVLEIQDPRVRVLGFVSEEEKFALLRGSTVFLMPSPYESLSIVALEAWAVGRPILANAECLVLKGQCIRSGGGLFYLGYREFAESLKRLLGDQSLRAALGRQGASFVRREYDPETVTAKTEAFLETLPKRLKSA